jgi:Leucine-rich repeat (LRR) protein
MVGEVPSEIGSLSQLSELSLANNSFEGIVPSEIANLNNLVTLMLNNNKFETNIDERIANIPTLVDFKFISSPRIKASMNINSAIVFD